MSNKVLDSQVVKSLVTAAGFDLCGVSRAEYLEESASRFDEWIGSGYGDGLEYLYRNRELRFDVRQMVEGARTVVVCVANYKSEYSLRSCEGSGVGIASYALMRDYHKSIKSRLKRVLTELQKIDPGLSGRIFTDSAPLLEKHYAVRASLGWIGRQSLFVTPEFGTFVLLGELVIDREVDCYDDGQTVCRTIEVGCGECRRCVDSCPVSAINENRTIDTRRCIASRTIEHESAGDEPLAGWVFGCDICQRCCPHNQRTPLASEVDMQPRIEPKSADEWLSMDAAEFAEYAQGTPLRRSTLERIHQNIKLNKQSFG